MKLKDIRTRSNFIEFLQEHSFELEIKDEDYGEVADWFLAMQEARMTHDFDTKDMAHMFLSGVVGIQQDPEKAHADWWGSMWEDVEWLRESGNDEDAAMEEHEQALMLEGQLREHFGADDAQLS
jgi:hypothetical protein